MKKKPIFKPDEVALGFPNRIAILTYGSFGQAAIEDEETNLVVLSGVLARLDEANRRISRKMPIKFFFFPTLDELVIAELPECSMVAFVHDGDQDSENVAERIRRECNANGRYFLNMNLPRWTGGWSKVVKDWRADYGADLVKTLGAHLLYATRAASEMN